MVVGWIVIAVIVLVIVAKVAASTGGKAQNARLRGYGVVVDGDEVKSGGKVLGPLAGAHAEVTGISSRHTLTRVVTVAGALTKRTKATVIVVCPSGGVHEWHLNGAAEVRRAEAWCIRFNALAAAAGARGAAGPARA